MTKIFISYRRDDSAGQAGRLFDRLSRDFGRDQVFMDVTGIQPGMDFVEAIERAVGACDVLLVVIGADWSGPTASGGSRLENPNDFVALEAATALARGVRVVPVLVQGARLPLDAELPEKLKPLLRRNAFELRDSRWDADVGELSRALAQLPRAPRSTRKLGSSVRTWSLLFAGAGVVTAGTFIRAATSPDPAPSSAPAPATPSEKVEPPAPPITPAPAPPDRITVVAPLRASEPANGSPSASKTAGCNGRGSDRNLYTFDAGVESWSAMKDRFEAAISWVSEGCAGSGALKLTVPAGVGDDGAGVFVDIEGPQKSWSGRTELRVGIRAEKDSSPFGEFQVYVLSADYDCVCVWSRAGGQYVPGRWEDVRLALTHPDDDRCETKGGATCRLDDSDVDQIGIKLYGTVAPTTLYVDHLWLE